jgi:hypothetical protein
MVGLTWVRTESTFFKFKTIAYLVTLKSLVKVKYFHA